MEVIFIGCDEDQKRWGNNTGDTSALIVGKKYTVREEEVHSWHTKYYLDGFEGSFNSVCFKKYYHRAEKGVRKYQKGKQVVSMVQLAKVFGEGRNIYIRDKYTHQGWALSMQYRVLMNAVKAGVVWEALLNDQKEDV